MGLVINKNLFIFIKRIFPDSHQIKYNNKDFYIDGVSKLISPDKIILNLCILELVANITNTKNENNIRNLKSELVSNFNPFNSVIFLD